MGLQMVLDLQKIDMRVAKLNFVDQRSTVGRLLSTWMIRRTLVLDWIGSSAEARAKFKSNAEKAKTSYEERKGEVSAHKHQDMLLNAFVFLEPQFARLDPLMTTKFAQNVANVSFVSDIMDVFMMNLNIVVHQMCDRAFNEPELFAVSMNSLLTTLFANNLLDCRIKHGNYGYDKLIYFFTCTFTEILHEAFTEDSDVKKAKTSLPKACVPLNLLHSYDTWFLPFKVHDNHFIVLMLHLDAGEIVVYDSSYNTGKYVEQTKKLLKIVIKWLCWLSGKFYDIELLSKPLQDWKIKLTPHWPQQSDGGDGGEGGDQSGPAVCCLAWYILNNLPLDYDHENTVNFRYFVLSVVALPPSEFSNDSDNQEMLEQEDQEHQLPILKEATLRMDAPRETNIAEIEMWQSMKTVDILANLTTSTGTAEDNIS
jgi:hypothetical protein